MWCIWYLLWWLPGCFSALPPAGPLTQPAVDHSRTPKKLWSPGWWWNLGWSGNWWSLRPPLIGPPRSGSEAPGTAGLYLEGHSEYFSVEWGETTAGTESPVSWRLIGHWSGSAPGLCCRLHCRLLVVVRRMLQEFWHYAAGNLGSGGQVCDSLQQKVIPIYFWLKIKYKLFWEYCESEPYLVVCQH